MTARFWVRSNCVRVCYVGISRPSENPGLGRVRVDQLSKRVWVRRISSPDAQLYCTEEVLRMIYVDDYVSYRLGPLKSDEDDHTETNPILPGPIGLSEAIAQKARSVEDVQPSSTAVEYSESPVDSTHSPSTDFVVQPASVSRSGGMAPPPAPPPPPPPVMNDHGSQVVDSKIIKSLLKPLRWTKLDTSADVGK